MLRDGFDKSLLHWDNKCNVHALYSSRICLACKEQVWSKQCTCCIHHASALLARNKCGQNNVHVVFIMHLPCSQGTNCGQNKNDVPDIPVTFLKDPLVVGTDCLIALLGPNVPAEELRTLSFKPHIQQWGMADEWTTSTPDM